VMRSSEARNDAPGFGQTIAAVSREFCSIRCSAQQHDQDDKRNRDSDQPKKNGHMTFLSG
jgi:hypothetical protein